MNTVLGPSWAITTVSASGCPVPSSDIGGGKINRR